MIEEVTSQIKGQETEATPKKCVVKKLLLGLLVAALVFFSVLVWGGLLLLHSVKGSTDLGITFSPQDFANFVQKTGITLNSEADHLCFTCLVKYAGRKEVNFNLTSEEISAWFDSVNSREGLFSETQIKVEVGRVSCD